MINSHGASTKLCQQSRRKTRLVGNNDSIAHARVAIGKKHDHNRGEARPLKTQMSGTEGIVSVAKAPAVAAIACKLCVGDRRVQALPETSDRHDDLNTAFCPMMANGKWQIGEPLPGWGIIRLLRLLFISVQGVASEGGEVGICSYLHILASVGASMR